MTRVCHVHGQPVRIGVDVLLVDGHVLFNIEAIASQLFFEDSSKAVARDYIEEKVDAIVEYIK